MEERELIGLLAALLWPFCKQDPEDSVEGALEILKEVDRRLAARKWREGK